MTIVLTFIFIDNRYYWNPRQKSQPEK